MRVASAFVVGGRQLHGLAAIGRDAPEPRVEARHVDDVVAIGVRFTRCRATLVFVADNQNVTLSLPRGLLRQVKRLAADRETSVSALMTEALARLADEDRRYSAAKKRALTAMKSARSLGTAGRPSWARDDLHER